MPPRRSLLLVPLVLATTLCVAVRPERSAAACRQPARQPAAAPRRPPAATPVAVGLTAVLTDKEATKLFHPCSHAAPKDAGRWNPTAADIAAMNAALPAFLAAQEKKRSDPAHPLKLAAYYRQSAGFQRNARKRIFVSAFAPRMKDEMELDFRTHRKVRDWRRNAFDICDGGTLMLAFEYDVATKTFDHVSFNGR